MKKLYVHGLGQTSSSWNEVIKELNACNESACPNLFDLLQNNEASYHNLYKAFEKYCNACDEKLDLCGLSLGGILSLNYVIDYPEKVNSLVLIGTPYKMPKKLLKFQSFLFRFMPNSSFEKMGLSKQDFIYLCQTMSELDFSNDLSKIACKTLVVCGEKDFANKKVALNLAKYLINGKLSIIKGSGHEVNTEHPKSLAKVLKAFYTE